MQIAQLFVMILSLFTLSTAKADLLIEPVLGFNMDTTFKIDNGSTDGGGMGVGYGGRLGYQNLGFQLGLDYLKSSINMDAYDNSIEMSEWAAFVGFKFPILLKVYAGYIFSANAQTKVSGGGTSKLEDGTGYKVGVGSTLLPFLDVNLEYRSGTFGKTASTSVSTDYSSYLLSFSLPFTL